jgi:hypothetical protein
MSRRDVVSRCGAVWRRLKIAGPPRPCQARACLRQLCSYSAHERLPRRSLREPAQPPRAQQYQRLLLRNSRRTEETAGWPTARPEELPAGTPRWAASECARPRAQQRGKATGGRTRHGRCVGRGCARGRAHSASPPSRNDFCRPCHSLLSNRLWLQYLAVREGVAVARAHLTTRSSPVAPWPRCEVVVALRRAFD